MTRPTKKMVESARKAGKSMADRTTPFVFDEWYVAAFSDEVSRELLPRTLLGKQLVFYRTGAGEPVALDDRCAHRSFPLSASRLEGDTIVCGYHGFRYDSEGNCVEVPSLNACPRAIGVKRYPLVEIGPLVWIWMGDVDKADKARIPDVYYVDHPEWQCSKGYLPLAGNYVSLHENLLDLTHLSFVHANSFGTPDYAAAPFKTEYGDGRFKVTREVNPTRLPPVWAEPSGLTGVDTAVRIATSEFVTPAYHRVATSFFDGAVHEDKRQVCSIQTAHLPTPETQNSTHYFIVHARDFALDQEEVTNVMHERLFAAFAEDVEALSKLEIVLENTADEDFYEISVTTDGPGVAMRRYLLERARLH